MEKISRKILYFFAILGVVLMTGYGCSDDFYNEKAGDRITPDQHYQSLVDAYISLQGAIVPLQDAMPRLIMLDGLRSDMMDVTPNADAYLRELNNQTISKSNPFADPSDYYKVIINVNEVLANIDQVASRDQEYDELTAHAFKGALIGLRAWNYLTLARLYNNVAYIDNNMISVPENISQTVLSKEEIINKLIEELIPYIHNDNAGPQFVEFRLPHYMNNKALLGELYLEINQYSNAANYLKLACESYLNQSAMLKVDKSYKDAGWGSIFLNAESNGLENISVIPYSRAENQNNPIPGWVGVNNQYLVKPTNIVIDSFLSQISAAGDTLDLYRIGITIGAEATIIDGSVNSFKPYIAKYSVDQNEPTSSDIIISRAADIHLMLAEAYNRMGDETSQKYALMLLNQGVNKENPKPAIFAKWSGNLGVRGRAYLNSRVVPDSITAEETTLLIEDFIIAERQLELAYEGKRWFDLIRIAQRRNSPEYLADKVAAKFVGTSQYEAVRNRLLDPANWYLPFN